MRNNVTYRFILRLGAKDLDIIALSETDGFTNAVKAALKAFATGKRFTFPMPQELPRLYKTKARIDFRFYEEDKDIADFLNSVSDGNKNAVVLAIIRASLPFPVISPYLEDDGVYYDLFIRKKKRGRRKGTAIKTPDNKGTLGMPDAPVRVESVIKSPVQEKPSPVQYAPATPTVDTNENVGIAPEKEEPRAVTLPSPAAPVRPSLVAAVEEEQAAEGIAEETADEGQTGDSTDNAGGDGFDPFAMGMDMMNSF